MYVVAFTGGPKGNKDGSQDRLTQHYGTKVLKVHEAATELMRDLFPQPGRDNISMDFWLPRFQNTIIPVQMNMEEAWQEVAKNNRTRVLTLNRGLLEGAGYLGITAEEFCYNNGWNLQEVYNRYDMVIHLETVAKSHPELFDNASNPQRYESSPEEACRIDDNLQLAWQGHPNWRFISGADGPEAVVAQVFELLSPHLDFEFEWRFLLRNKPKTNLGKPSYIEQGYMGKPSYIEQEHISSLTDGHTMRLRKEGHRIELNAKAGGQAKHSKWAPPYVPQWVYNGFWPLTEGRRIYKNRYTIPHGDFTLEFDEFLEDHAGLYILECEFEDEADTETFTLPNWAKGAVEITSDPRFKNVYLAQYGPWYRENNELEQIFKLHARA